MKSVPVLLITHDDLLWQRWRELDPERWLVARGRGLADLQRWRDQGRSRPCWTPTCRGCRPGRTPPGRRPWPASACWSPAPAPRRTGHPGLAAGAQGYCHSYAPPQALAQALEVISTGGIWMGCSLVSRLLRLVAEKGQDAGDWDGGLLTERETTAARYAAGGWANAQIAEALGITERTVKAHLSAVSRNWACPTACSWRCWCTASPRLANPAAKSS